MAINTNGNTDILLFKLLGILVDFLNFLIFKNFLFTNYYG